MNLLFYVFFFVAATVIMRTIRVCRLRCGVPPTSRRRCIEIAFGHVTGIIIIIMCVGAVDADRCDKIFL